MSRRDHEPLTPEERYLAGRLSRLDPHAAPSAALDAAILAAARAQQRAEAAPPKRMQRRPRRRPRWPVGLGIAASLAVAVGVAWQLRPLPESRVLSAPSELEVQRAVITEPAPAGAAIAPPTATGEADEAPAAGTGAATGAADRARPLSERRPAPPAPAEPTGPAAREQRENASTVDHAGRDAARKAEAGRAPAYTQRAATPPSEARAEEAATMDIVFDQVASPPPPPAPPAPPAPASREPGFVPSPPVAESAPRPEGEREDASLARRRLAAPAAAPPIAAVAEAEALDQIVVTGTRIEPDTATLDAHADQPLDDQPPASADSPAVRATWLQRIRELRDAGQAEEASASLREFVRRHPRAEVPVDLRPLLHE